MRTQHDRIPATVRQRWLVWVVLLALPAVKTTTFVVDGLELATWVRQLALVALLAAASLWVVSAATPAGERAWKRWVLAVGLRTDPSLADDGRWLQGRWALAVIGPVAGVAVTLRDMDRGTRWLGAAIAGGCLVGLAIAEALRDRSWRRRRSAGSPPDRHVLWTSGPLMLAGAGTAVVLAARDAGGVPRSELTELVVVTAAGEELLFRGCLLAMTYRVWRPSVAQVMAAASFGLWHAGNSWDASAGQLAGARFVHLAGTLLATFVGGLAFTFLRRRSHSLFGSIFAHIATNLPGKAVT